MILEDCKKGDKVILWCIGWNNWDTESVEIVSKGILIDVKYSSGRIARFASDTNCKTEIK